MIAATGQYAPVILRVRRNWRKLAGEHLQDGIYRLVRVEDGIHEFGSGGQAFRCGPGSFYLLQPNQREGWQASPNARAQMVAFCVATFDSTQGRSGTIGLVDQNHVQPMPRAVWGVDLPVVMEAAVCRRIEAPYQYMLAHAYHGDWERYRAHRALADLLDILVMSRQRGSDAGELSIDAPLLTRVRYLVGRELAQIPNGQALAGLLGVSREHLTRVCKAASGETPTAYLKRVRLERAADLIRSTDWNLGHIARHVGYRSQAAFNQAWARHFDKPPLAWRRQYR